MSQNCYGYVIDALSDISAEISSKYYLSSYKLCRIKEVCAQIDNLMGEAYCDSFNVIVNSTLNRLTINLICFDIILQNGRSHEFFDLIQKLSSFSFSNAGDDNIQIALNIDNVWEEIYE